MAKPVAVAKTLVLNSKNQVLILRRGMTAPRRPGEWDLPGGFVDEGEDITTTAVRETEEETGLAVGSVEIAYAFTELTIENGKSCTFLFFLAQCKDEKKLKISWEHDEAKWVSWEELCDFITYDRQQRAIKYVLEKKLVHNAS